MPDYMWKRIKRLEEAHEALLIEHIQIRKIIKHARGILVHCKDATEAATKAEAVLAILVHDLPDDVRLITDRKEEGS